MLNKHLWSQGVRNVPKRVRVRLERRRDEDEEAKEKVRDGVLLFNILFLIHCIVCSFTLLSSMSRFLISTDFRLRTSLLS